MCVNGGSRAEVPGVWAATLEWLVERLAPRFPGLRFVEVRYRVKSWNQLGMCIDDGRAAVDSAVADGARACALLGFSMGGAVAVGAAGHPAVTTVLGLAPWLPDRLDLGTLEGRRLAVFHGTLDRYLPGIPGVSPASSKRGYERARARGIDASYTLIRGGLHGTAIRGFGGLVPLPRARRWAESVAGELARFQAAG